MKENKWHKRDEKCSICHGTGKINNNECTTCNGTGKITLHRISDGSFQLKSDALSEDQFTNLVIQWFNEDREATFDKELTEASDRAIVILGAAILDDSLRQLITNFLVKDETERKEHDEYLFEGNGPLANFSARINISYRLGLISKTEEEELNLIRKIRNKFAHDVDFSSFNYDKPTRDRCYQLRAGRADRSLSPQMSFILSVSLLKRSLKLRSIQAEQERRKLKSQHSIAEELVDLALLYIIADSQTQQDKITREPCIIDRDGYKMAFKEKGG